MIMVAIYLSIAFFVGLIYANGVRKYVAENPIGDLSANLIQSALLASITLLWPMFLACRYIFRDKKV